MNKKVLKTMIALVIVFLLGLYVVKIFFPEQFVLCVENETFIKIGNYIDAHKWAEYSFGIVTSFATYWFYLCATCRKWYLKWYECLIVLAAIGASIGLSFWDANIYTSFSVMTFILLPCLFKSTLNDVCVCFSIHTISQVLTLSIRNIPLFMTHVNSLTINVIGCESFIWLVLLYFVYNYKKEV